MGTSTEMRIFFAGTPEIAVPSLEALVRFPDVKVVGVLTNPDRPVGRGNRIELSPVKRKALEIGLRVYQPEKLDEGFFDVIRFLQPDLLVVFAYGKIFSSDFLTLFPRGGINIHPSLLPRWRGPSPIQAAILNRDRETGFSIQLLSQKMDSGDILYQETVLLGGRETTETMTDLFAGLCGEALISVVARFDEYMKTRTPQDEEYATYCKKLCKEDGLIDWNRSAAEIDALVRACVPWPKAYTFFNDIELFLITVSVFDKMRLPFSLVSLAEQVVPGTVFGFLKRDGFLVKTGDGILSVSVLQLKSRKALDAASFKNGLPEIVGTCLGSK